MPTIVVNSSMTRMAQRLNIEFVRRFIAEIVMIMRRLFFAVGTQKLFGRGDFPRLDSMHDHTMGFFRIRMFLEPMFFSRLDDIGGFLVAPFVAPRVLFPILDNVISILFSILSVVFTFAHLAAILCSIFATRSSSELIQWFELTALGTSFYSHKDASCRLAVSKLVEGMQLPTGGRTTISDCRPTATIAYLRHL